MTNTSNPTQTKASAGLGEPASDHGAGVGRKVSPMGDVEVSSTPMSPIGDTDAPAPCPPWCAVDHTGQRYIVHETAPAVSALTCHAVRPGPAAQIRILGAIEQNDDQRTVHLHWGDGESLMLEIGEARTVVANLNAVLDLLTPRRLSKLDSRSNW